MRIPPRQQSGVQPSALRELREGWSLFAGTTWLWVVVLAFSVMNAIHSGAWFTLGPPIAKATIGEQGWGYVLSAESIGLLAMTAVMLRRRLERPLLVGSRRPALLGFRMAQDPDFHGSLHSSASPGEGRQEALRGYIRADEFPSQGWKSEN